MPTPKENFFTAASNVGWSVSDNGINTLADQAEALFDHAPRGSDAWATIMVPVRDAVARAEAGQDVAAVQEDLQVATERAERKGVALPGSI